MKKLLVFLLASLPFAVSGQKVDRSVIVPGGEYYEAPSTNIEWTLGELAVGDFMVGDILLTQGFHQGNLVVTSIRGPEPLIQLKAYPNPVLDILIIETEKPDLGYRLVDINGSVLENGKIRSVPFELDLTGFPSGIYFLWIEEYQTHKIIKK